MASNLPPAGTFVAHSDEDFDVPQEALDDFQAAILRVVEENSNCSICHETILSVEDTITLRCQHCFHDLCMSYLVEHQVGHSPFQRYIHCPLCRRRCQVVYGLWEDEPAGLWRRTIFEEYPDYRSLVGSPSQGRLTTLRAMIPGIYMGRATPAADGNANQAEMATPPVAIPPPVLEPPSAAPHTGIERWQIWEPVAVMHEPDPRFNYWPQAAPTPLHRVPAFSAGYRLAHEFIGSEVDLRAHLLRFPPTWIHSVYVGPPAAAAAQAPYHYVSIPLPGSSVTPGGPPRTYHWL